MDKRIVYILVVIVGVIFMVYGTGFFGGGEEIETLTVQGSTTVLPIVQRVAEKYMDLNSTVNIQVSGGGSSVGVISTGEGTADIGMASRELKNEETTEYPHLTTIAIARDGIAMIVHPENLINSLTVEEVKKIYKGTYSNWSQLGGKDLEIVVVGRDSASGTREFFWTEVMEKEDFVENMLEKNSNGAIKQTVAQTPGAIGYVGLGYIDESVEAVRIKSGEKDIEPTVANVRNGSYPISRNLYLLVSGEPTGLIKDFIDFILSLEGQAIVEEEGFVPL